MKQFRPPARARDYSGIFLVPILLGIIVIVLGLLMAAARSSARLSDAAEKPGAPSLIISGMKRPAGFTINAGRYIFPSMEPYRTG